MTGRARIGPSPSTALWILAVLGALFFLRSARTLLIPIAMAVLISYALEPAVAWLERHRIPRIAGATLVLLLTLAGLAGGGYALKDDVAQAAKSLPQAVDRARAGVAARLGSVGGATQTGSESGGPVGTSGESGGSSGGGSLLQRAAGAVFAFAGHLVVVIFLTLFLLVSGHFFRDRLVEIAGSDAERRRI